MRMFLWALLGMALLAAAVREWRLAGAAEPPAAPKLGGDAVRPDTAANRALDQNITIEAEGMQLTEALRLLADKGVNYVVNAESLERQERLHIRVKDIPIREVIPLIGLATGLKCEISPSGAVALYAEMSAEQRMLNPRRIQDMIERWRGMRGAPQGMMPGDPRLDNEGPEGGQPPRRGNRGRPQPEDRGENPPAEGKGEVF